MLDLNLSRISSDAVVIARAVPIEDELGRHGIRLRRQGRELVGPCPVCGGTDRFAVSIAKKIWNCRGCDKGGDIIDLVQHLDGGEFLDAVETLTGQRPLGDATAAREHARERDRINREEKAREDARKTADALRWWNEGINIWNTPAQAYLASRACAGMFPVDRDAVFRWHPTCPFGGGHMPCLLALYRNVITDDPQGVHRTPLTLDGKRPIGPDGETIKRKTYGPTTNAAIKLWPANTVGNRLVVGEGIETSVSAALHIRHRGQALTPAWACMNAGNIGDLPVLEGVETLTILVDNDPSGTGQRESAKCAERWRLAGREVFRLIPKVSGFDFNDIINHGRG
jgi:Toprim domain/CHC2 zinc finger